MTEKTLVEKQTRKQPASIKFRSPNLSKNSLKIYSMAIRQFISYCEKNNIELGQDSVRSWLNTFENPKTFNLRRTALKEYLLKLYENEPAEKQLELHSFFKTIKSKKVKKEMTTDFLTLEQIQSLVKVCQSKEMILIIWALFWSGCRVNELLNIKLKGIKEGREFVSIQIVGKGQKEREVYLPKELYSKIKKIFKHSQIYLFETKKNTTFHSNNISEYIRRAGKRLNLTISAHTLRHSKAMFLKDVQHLSPDQVAKALGHSSVLTTLQHYYHGTPTAEEQGII